MKKQNRRKRSEDKDRMRPEYDFSKGVRGKHAVLNQTSHRKAKKIPNPSPGFDELSIEEKLDYVQSLWDRIAAKPATVPVLDWHLQVIKERLSQTQRAGRSWDAFREEVRSKLRKRKSSR